MDEPRLEVKVGLMVLGTVAAVLGLFFLMGDYSFGNEAGLTVDFAHTGNVVRGAPVKLGGIPVGRVEGITLHPARRDERGNPLLVSMALSLDDGALSALHEDAAVHVATVGPLGEPYLELEPGTASLPALDGKKPLRGVDAIRLDVVAANAARFLDSATELLEDDPRALATLIQGIGRLSNTLDEVLKENKGDVRVMSGELAQAAKDFRLLSKLARAAMEPGGQGAVLLAEATDTAKLVQKEVPEVASEARAALRGVTAVTSNFSAEDGRALKAALHKYAAAGEKLDALATRAERVLAKMEAGEGTIGGMYKDPQVYEDLKSLVSDLKRNPWKVLWKD